MGYRIGDLVTLRGDTRRHYLIKAHLGDGPRGGPEVLLEIVGEAWARSKVASVADLRLVPMEPEFLD